MMDNLTPYQRAKLLLRYLRDELNDQELADMQAWLKEHPEQQQFVDRLINDRGMEAHYTLLSNIDQPAAWNSLQQKLELGSKTTTFRLWPRVAVAAAVIGMAIGVYFYTSRHFEGSSAGRHPELVSGSQDIPPGGNNATLTVGNGKPMQLSQAQNTVVVGDDFRYGDGSSLPVRGLSPLGGERIEAGIPNITATTLRGGMYTIILPDNTKVWLNNDSELEFPAKFGKNVQRIVKLIGEAYFEVARDTKRPFVVQSAGQNVTVLGTHFNISAYQGEKIRTTLLEGSVRVAPLSAMGREALGREVLLKPNQQSILTGNALTVTQVDIEEEMAWKNGYFRFNLEGIQDIMRKLSRWYNIDVAYQGKITTEKFTGTVTRDKNISQVLLMLEQTKGVHFKIEGRKVIVMQ